MALIKKEYISRTDVKIVFSDGTMDVNKQLLCMFSSYFDKLYFSNFKEKTDDIQLLDFKKNTFEQLLSIIIDEKITLTSAEEYADLIDILQFLDIQLKDTIISCMIGTILKMSGIEYS